MTIGDGESFIGLCGMIGAVALPLLFYLLGLGADIRERAPLKHWVVTSLMGMCFGGHVGIILLFSFPILEAFNLLSKQNIANLQCSAPIIKFSYTTHRQLRCSPTMQSEHDTAIEERYLWLEGRVSSASMERIKAGLPATQQPDTETLFVGFAYADLPFTKRFDVVFPKGRPQDGISCECRVVAATQQWGKPFPSIPAGWKTICVIHFAGGIPQLVQRLPVVDRWYQNAEWVCICDKETWEHLKKGDSPI